MAKRLHTVVCLAAILSLDAPAFAARCSADASDAGYELIDGHNFLFRFDVESDACTDYSCQGYVHFAIRYRHALTGATSTDRALVRYTIRRGNSRTSVSIEHHVGATDGTRILDVAVEEVTCSSP